VKVFPDFTKEELIMRFL